MTSLLILCGLAVCLLLGLAGLWQMSSGAAVGAQVAERSGLETAERSLFAGLREEANRRLAATSRGAALIDRMRLAGVEIDAATFLVAAAVVGVLGYFLFDRWLPKLLAVAVGLGLVRACWYWIEWKATKRREAFIAQLPDAARIISNASSAGLATRTAVDMAVSELAEPGKSELALVAEELRIGQSLDAALMRLEKRMPSRDIGVLINTLVIQQRSGGDLVRSLQEIADTLEARRDLHREVKTVMSGAVATGYLVAALGAGSLVLINLSRPGIIEVMTSYWSGRLALAAAASLFVLGFVLIRRLTSIDL